MGLVPMQVWIFLGFWHNSISYLLHCDIILIKWMLLFSWASVFLLFQENLGLKNSKEELNVQLHQDGYFGATQVDKQPGPSCLKVG